MCVSVLYCIAVFIGVTTLRQLPPLDFLKFSVGTTLRFQWNWILRRIHSVRVYKATFNRPKNMTLRQYCDCAHCRISNWRTEDIYNTLARVLVYNLLTTQISRLDSSQSVPWRDKDDVTLTRHLSDVVSTFFVEINRVISVVKYGLTLWDNK